MNNQLQNLRLAVQMLLECIDVSTDCMSNQIKRENIDDHIDVLKAIIEIIGEPMSFQVQELRPEVLRFALLMEQRLRENDEELGMAWKFANPSDLFPSFMSKAFSTEKAIFSPHRPSPVKDAVDVANYAMMIADVSGALGQPE